MNPVSCFLKSDLRRSAASVFRQILFSLMNFLGEEWAARIKMLYLFFTISSDAIQIFAAYFAG